MKVKRELIKNTRRHKRFSQEYIAYLLDVSQSQYSRLENGEIDFEISKLSSLIDILELNPMEVIEFTEKQLAFINSHNTIGSNIGKIKSPIVINDLNIIQQIIRDELDKRKE